jgi:NIMA (never in mitosis gene a)-related kinase
MDNYEKVKKLGEGGFGKVFLVTDKRDHKQYVMKEVQLGKLDAKGKQDAMREVNFMIEVSFRSCVTSPSFVLYALSSSPRSSTRT